MSTSLIGLFPEHHRTIPDERDIEIAKARLQRWDEDPEPRVGDFCIMSDGTYERLSYRWPDGYQTSPGGHFYLGEEGYVSLSSGGLNPTIPKEKFEIITERKEGYLWFFHWNDHCADNGIGVLATCRVYQIKE